LGDSFVTSRVETNALFSMGWERLKFRSSEFASRGLSLGTAVGE
jgi:hypothetical protein